MTILVFALGLPLVATGLAWHCQRPNDWAMRPAGRTISAVHGRILWETTARTSAAATSATVARRVPMLVSAAIHRTPADAHTGIGRVNNCVPAAASPRSEIAAPLTI
jgi:hypothetical protein